MFALTRQARLIEIVATQSIPSLRAVLVRSEAWRALLQTLRTRIFLSLADDSSEQMASTLCGHVARMKASCTVSEQTQRAGASLLSGSAGGGTGSVGASKAFSERSEPLFHPARLRPTRQLPGHRHAFTTGAARSMRGAATSSQTSCRGIGRTGAPARAETL